VTRRAFGRLLLVLLSPTSAAAQSGNLDAFRRAEILMSEGSYDAAQSRLEGLLYTELAAPSTFYLGWIQYRSVGNLDSAWALIRQSLTMDYSLDVQQYKDFVGPEYLVMFDRTRDEIARQSPAFVTVTAHPWANVTIDEEELGATPLINYRLTPGRHTVVLSRDGFRRQSETLVLPPGTHRLVGPVSLQGRTDTIVVPHRPLRERARHEWSMRTILALDSGDTREATRQLGLRPEADSLVGLWHVLRGVIHQLEGASDSAQQRYREAIEVSPGVLVGPDDVNPAIARLFGETREQMRPVVSFLMLSPDSIMVNRDEVYIRLTARRTARVAVQLRHLATGGLVWQTDVPGDSVIAVRWDGRRSPDLGGGPVPSGQYELAVQPVARLGIDGSGFTKLLDIRSAPPDTSLDLGEIPDSLLVKETRSRGARAASIVQGVLFGAAAGALPSVAGIGWDLPGLDPASGAVAIGSVTAAVGLLGAILLDTTKPLPERVARNARARARWEAQRNQLRDLNAERLTQPYPLTARVVQ
jgi:PAS domain-containing protein